MIDFIETLGVLSRTKSPSGFEKDLSQVISELAGKYADEITKDALGNLTVHKKGSGKRLMLAAHMDTTGLLATHIDEDGFIRFGALGALPTADLHHAPVEFLNGVRGVVSYEEKTEIKDRKLEHFYIDIGAANEKDAKSRVMPGDAAVFCSKPQILGENRVCAPYLDNRIGCALLLMALSSVKTSEYDLYFVFTALDETGLRGSKTAAYTVNPDFALSVGVTGSGDVPGFKTVTEAKLGGGAAIKVMDKSILAHPEIVSALTETASKNGIPVQQDIITAYGSSAGSIHLTRGGVRTGGISVPVRYQHSPCETADLGDVSASLKLLCAVIEQTVFF